MRRLLTLGGLTLAVTLGSSCGGSTPKQDATAMKTDESPAAVVERWRAKHEADYRREYSTIAGLLPLKPGPNTVGSAAFNDVVLPASTPARIGRFVAEADHVRFEPATGVPVRLRDQPITSTIELRDDSTTDADELEVGVVRVVIHLTGTERMVRVRDPEGPLAKGFLGFSWFPIDPVYRVVGHFIKDAEPRKVKVANTYGDLDEYTTEGVVEFALQGQTLRLRPFTTRPKRFYFVFRDGSSGQETYGAARFLYADLADDGSVVMDFNMAYNPPCSFNPYTTCPIPIQENRLTSVKILAGEKKYPAEVTLPTRSSK